MSTAASRAGPYELLKPLSSGGMGEVFVARLFDGASEKRVAVKLMLSYLAGEPELVTRFLDEVRLASRMKHPNVVQIFDVGMTDNRPWLAMELVEGVSLYALLERSRQRNTLLPLPLVRLIAQGLLDALAYAHSLDGLQVIHRDVSPSNILVSIDGVVRLTDFGLARARTNATRTSPGGFKAGKLGYMAPELALTDAVVDQRSDVFSAGVTLFETLTLLQPFRRLGASDAQTLEAVATGDALSPSATRAEAGPAMGAALVKAMRPVPAERFTSVAELKAAFIDGEVGSPAALGALVRNLCPEELAKFFSIDELPQEQVDAPTVSFTLGPSGGVTPLISATADTTLTSVEAILDGTGDTDVISSVGVAAPHSPEPATAVHLPPRRIALLVGLGFVLVAGVAFALGTMLRRPAPDTAAPVVTAAPVAPAAPAQAVALPAPADTEVPDEDEPELELLPSPTLHMGFVTAECEPSAMVYLDGKPLAATPLVRHVVPIGHHLLTFKTKRGDVRKKILVGEGKSLTFSCRR